jgi:hypothetical protein
VVGWRRDGRAECIDRLAEKPIGDKKLGPYTINWERPREALEAELCERLGLPAVVAAGSTDIRGAGFSAGARLPGQREVEAWLDARRRLRGDVLVSVADLRACVHRCVQRLRAQPRRTRGLRAMTVHQAKNQEFERVLVLWSVEVGGDAEAKRRLLYNAVTRAKILATIIVQDPNPKKSRLMAPPFA